MTQLRIRLATADDLQVLLDLTAEDAIRAFVEPTTPTDNQRAALAELIADPVHDLLVGEMNGRIVTTAHLSWLRVLMYDGGLMCQIESVRTTTAMRGQGIGNQLMTQSRQKRVGAAPPACNSPPTRSACGPTGSINGSGSPPVIPG